MLTTKNEIKLEKEFFAQKSAIIAKSGYGKSYTARVLIEEAIKEGHPFLIIDPQGAYRNLPEFDYIDATQVKSAKILGKILAQTNKKVVLETKRLSERKQQLFVNAVLTSYKMHLQKGIQTILIDEMHKFAPEGQKTPALDIIRSFHQENRSDGVGFIGITQRPQRMDKTCLSQCDNLIVGRVTSYRDKDAVKNYLDNAQDVDIVSKLGKGEMYFIGIQEEPIVAQVREAETEHSGDSPTNLLNENNELYSKAIGKAVVLRKGNQKMEATKEIEALVPNVDTLFSFAKQGMKVGAGLAVAGVASSVIGSRIKSPIPMVSSRTLGAGATTIALYAGYKLAKKQNMNLASDLLGHATAGSSAFLLGSAVGDVLNVAGVSLPNFAQFALTTATGASPVTVEKNNDAVDVKASM